MERYQVFISSTYTDLKEERQAVLESILKLRQIPVGMEHFVATSDEQFGYIKKLIDETDYYILIIGNRYGTLTNEGISITEKEFDYAVSKNVPILAFVHSSPDSLPVNKSEVSATARKQLSKFREKVMYHRLVSIFSWDNPDSLAREVVTALSNAIKDYPRPGWVRANSGPLGKKASEIYDLYRSVQLQMMDMEYPFESERIMSAFASYDGTEAKTTIRDSISNMMTYGSREYRYPLTTIVGPFFAVALLLKDSTFLSQAESVTLLAICGRKISSEDVERLVKSLRKRYLLKEPITYDYQTMDEWEDSYSRIVLISRFSKTKNYPAPIVTSNLPTLVSFFSLYNVKTASELNIHSRWEKADSVKTLSVPIGVDGNGKTFFLDLQETIDGPNAIVAGMVGSGKTEFLVSYIISLAINYPPDAVGFILIDCKGGELIDKLHSLPHYLGGLSDLNYNSINRMIVGLRAELLRRQKLLNANRANSIYEYTKKYQEDGSLVPMPHLFVVVDELGEIKATFPEFHLEIMNFCRVGRLLGIHILWGTQRAAGVIDDQTWSNAKTRICLKVVTPAESMDLLKRPDASYIDAPGRGYVQSGYSELSATMIQFVFGGEKTLFGRKQTDEIITYLHREYYKPFPIPIILPPLSFNISYSFVRTISNEKHDKIPLGVYDDLKNQRQGVAYYDYCTSNLLAVGASRTGKTNLLLCIIRSCAVQYSPDEMNLFIIEAGRPALGAFEGLPIVGGVISSLEWPRLAHLVNYFRQEIEIRKKEFSIAGVTDFASYKALYPNRFPSIILLIDNIGELRAPYHGDDDWLPFFCIYGLTFGISIVATAPSVDHIGFRLLTSFASRIAFNCPQKSDYEIFLEGAVFPLPNSPGRCFVKNDQSIFECQIYKAFDGTDTSESLEFVNRYSQKECTNAAYKIPSLPAVLDENYVFSHYNNEMDEVGKVVIGMSYDSLSPSVLSLKKTKLFLLSGKNGSSEATDFIDYLVTATERTHPGGTQWYIADNSDQKLFSLHAQPNVVLYGANASDNTSIFIEVEQQLLLRDTVHCIDESKGELPLLILVLNDPSDLSRLEKSSIQEYLETESNLENNDLCVIISGYGNNPVRFNSPSILKRAKEIGNGIMFHSISEIKPLDPPVSLLRKYRAEGIQTNDFYFFHNEECDYVMGIRPNVSNAFNSDGAIDTP